MYLILSVEREKETPGPAVSAEPVESSELREVRVRLTTIRTTNRQEEQKNKKGVFSKR